MSKNILVITGSPRKGHNSDTLAESFVKGAREKGHTVNVFNATAKDIGGCKACDTCWSKGRACSFSDGFTDLEPLLEQADALVFATPLYWFGFSAQIKAAIDKLYAYNSPNALRKLKIKESALLACAGDTDAYVFDGLARTYEIMVDYLKWKNAGTLLVAGVYDKGDIDGSEALQRAEQMGRDF